MTHQICIMIKVVERCTRSLYRCNSTRYLGGEEGIFFEIYMGGAG